MTQIQHLIGCPSPPGIMHCPPRKNLFFIPFNKPIIDQAPSLSTNKQRKNMANILPSWPCTWSITHKSIDWHWLINLFSDERFSSMFIDFRSCSKNRELRKIKGLEYQDCTVLYGYSRVLGKLPNLHGQLHSNLKMKTVGAMRRGLKEAYNFPESVYLLVSFQSLKWMLGKLWN